MSSPRAKLVVIDEAAPGTANSSSVISPELLKAWSTSQVVDILYRHQLRVEAFKPTSVAHKHLEAELIRRCETDPADAIIPLTGFIALANLGAKPSKRTVTSPVKLFRLMRKYSAPAFEAICDFALSDVDRYIPEERHAEFLTKANSGKRSVSVFAKPEAEQNAVEDSPKAA